MPKTIWTIGHSTRSFEELVAALKANGIELLADVRTVPRSRFNPQFNKDLLERDLPGGGVEYVHVKELGGLRGAKKDSINTGWRNASFRGFADYMQTPAFDAALKRLMDLAEEKRVAIMCAEVVPWRCHRSLIADALTAHGFEVIEIYDEAKSEPHKMTRFAVIDGETISYPASEETTSP